MEQLSESLLQLVKQACQHPPGSKERQKNLTKIIRLVSTQLWRENSSYYEDALQETWFYFCRNICEGLTAKPYDAERASVVTWLNNYLKWRLKEGYLKAEQQKQQRVFTRIHDNNPITDVVDNLPAPTNRESSFLLDEIKQWVLTDSQNKLRQIYLKDQPQITAQALILARLPPEIPWKTLAAEYGVTVGTLSSFYQRKCKPLLREYSKSQGYI
jgi:hypothetical protein